MAAVDPGTPMLVKLPPRPLTLDDVAGLAAVDEVHRYELDEGNLVIMAPADKEHAALIIRIGAWLLNHGYGDDQVLANPGVRIRKESAGRSPDLMVLGGSVPDDTVWIDPAEVLLVVDIVSRGSTTLDRVEKPIDYAHAGIDWYWRVERGGGKPTVHMYQLGVDQRGEPAYIGHHAVLLEDLLAGDPPKLS